MGAAFLRSFADAYQANEEAPARRLSISGIPPGRRSQRRVRRSAGAGRETDSTLKKTRCGVCGREQSGWYDRRVRQVRDLPCGPYRIFLQFEVRRLDCRTCGAVKREALDFLSDSPFYTQRFAYYVGRRCREASIKAVADELHLDWDSVKTLEKQYMQAQLTKAGTPAPKRIGIDEISIRKGHTYRIVVSDLDRRRPIWFGGEDRSEASMAMFYADLGAKKSTRIDLALMDMWKPFRNAAKAHAPQAAVLFDKFHVMRHLGDALDTVRKTEYARVSGQDRRFIKGRIGVRFICIGFLTKIRPTVSFFFPTFALETRQSEFQVSPGPVGRECASAVGSTRDAVS